MVITVFGEVELEEELGGGRWRVGIGALICVPVLWWFVTVQQINLAILELREAVGDPVGFVFTKWFGAAYTVQSMDGSDDSTKLNMLLVYIVGGVFGAYFIVVFVRYWTMVCVNRRRYVTTCSCARAMAVWTRLLSTSCRVVVVVDVSR